VAATSLCVRLIIATNLHSYGIRKYFGLRLWFVKLCFLQRYACGKHDKDEEVLLVFDSFVHDNYYPDPCQARVKMRL
jgi:hypothetical protein